MYVCKICLNYRLKDLLVASSIRKISSSEAGELMNNHIIIGQHKGQIKSHSKVSLQKCC